MATTTSPAKFSFCVRLHRSKPDAWRYFKALVRGELAGHKPTRAELQAIGLAGHAYVRCSLGFARNVAKAGSVRRYFASVKDTKAKNITATEIQFRGDGHARQREHHRPPSRATAGRDDCEGGESAPDDVRDALLDARMHGCTCAPNIRRYTVNGHPHVRLGHQLTCPRLAALRTAAGMDRLPADVLGAVLRRADR